MRCAICGAEAVWHEALNPTREGIGERRGVALEVTPRWEEKPVRRWACPDCATAIALDVVQDKGRLGRSFRRARRALRAQAQCSGCGDMFPELERFTLPEYPDHAWCGEDCYALNPPE